MLLLDRLLERLKEKGLVKARGKVRTDLTHILMNARVLSRLELVAESFRAALNDLAATDPEWLRSVAKPVWFERYTKRIEDYRFPKGKDARHKLILKVAEDGYYLLDALKVKADQTLTKRPQVPVFKQVWKHHFVKEGDSPKLKEGSGTPLKERFNSPYDPGAKHGNKGSKQWEGYKLHITEQCDDDLPHIITHAVTTTADIMDMPMYDPTASYSAE